MSGIEFLFCPHIEHGVVFVGAQLFELFDIYVFVRLGCLCQFGHGFGRVLVELRFAIVAAKVDMLALIIEFD